MILYNVTIMVDSVASGDWLDWMRTQHIPDVMSTGYFVSHRLCRLLQPEPEQDTVTFAVQYYCSSIDKLNEYLVEAAPALRDKHTQRYGNKAQAFRTVLEILSDDPAILGDTLR